MPDPRPHPPEPADPGYGQFDLWLDTADADDGRARELAALLELASRPDRAGERPGDVESPPVSLPLTRRSKRTRPVRVGMENLIRRGR